ncbi:MAG: alpha/beta hydrolase [Myxococcota bacterium]
MSEDRFARVGPIEIAYRLYGPEDGVSLLLVGGIDTTLVTWDPAMIEMLTERGFRVLVADNRDSGLSTQLSGQRVGRLSFLARSLKGQLGKLGPAEVGYTLTDMATDLVGLLRTVGMSNVHLVGHSMGGMLAQEIAIAAPELVESLTCISASSGETGVGKPTPKAAILVAKATGSDVESAIEGLTRKYVFTGGPEADPTYARERAEISLRRANTPDGRLRRLLAVAATPNRVAALEQLPMPVVILHGALDPSIQVDGGRRLAELPPQAEYYEVPRMGHELIPPFFPDVVEAIERARALSIDPE